MTTIGRMRITTRDLFWLVLVCALALGWWLDHRTCVKHWRSAAFNHAWTSNKLQSLGYTQIFKNGRVADIQPPATNPSLAHQRLRDSRARPNTSQAFLARRGRLDWPTICSVLAHLENPSLWSICRCHCR